MSEPPRHTLIEVAVMADVAAYEVRYAVQQGTLPATLVGRKYLIDDEDAQGFVEYVRDHPTPSQLHRWSKIATGKGAPVSPGLVRAWNKAHPDRQYR